MKIAKSVLVRVFYDNRRYLGWTAASVIIAILGGLVPVGFSNLIGTMIDGSIVGENALLLRSGLTLIVLALAEMARSMIYGTINANGSERMFKAMRLRACDTLSHADTATFENRFSSGDVLTRMNSDMSLLCESLAGQFPWMMRAIMSGLASLVYCVMVSWQLSLVYIILLPMSVWCIKRISKPMKTFTLDESKHTGKAMNIASDALHGITTVKTFQLEETMDACFGESCDNAVDKAIQNERISIRLTAVKMLLTSLPICALLFLSILLLTNGTLTAGAVIAFIAASRSVDAAVRLSDSIASALRRSEAMAERIYELLDIPLEQQGEMTEGLKADVSILFDNVTFAYKGKDPILRSCTLAIPSGCRVGLVGASGCGKSSILSLINGIYLPNEGEVFLNGISTRDWETDHLREHISIVTQDSYLFDGTIRENIAGMIDATDIQIHAVLADVSLSDFISELPEGMNTRVNELGSRLSGGQRQRIAFARALLKDAPILLLDEPTSAIDQVTQTDLNKTLLNIDKKHTMVIVSHQFSLLKDLDWIFFIENGSVVEQGTIEQLTAMNGRFYHMMEKQMHLEEKYEQ